MSYICKIDNKTEVSAKFKNDYKKAKTECRDALIMDLFGEFGFDCGKTRWDSPILYTHMNSRKIVVAITCPSHCTSWDGCPYPTSPSQTFAFVHCSDYEVRIIDKDDMGIPIIKATRSIKSNADFTHWFYLPYWIRHAWTQ